MLSPEHQALYKRHTDGWRKRIPMNQRLAIPADKVAVTVEQALTASRPRARYVVGVPARIQMRLVGVTPTRVLDRLLSIGTGVPRKL